MNYALYLMQWLETEIVRLSHLRDRASEKGRRKVLYSLMLCRFHSLCSWIALYYFLFPSVQFLIAKRALAQMVPILLEQPPWRVRCVRV